MLSKRLALWLLLAGTEQTDVGVLPERAIFSLVVRSEQCAPAAARIYILKQRAIDTWWVVRARCGAHHSPSVLGVGASR